MTKEINDATSFNQGFFCAVASLVQMNGSHMEASELLRILGPVDLSCMADVDVDVIRRAGLLNQLPKAVQARKPERVPACSDLNFHCTFPECGCNR